MILLQTTITFVHFRTLCCLKLQLLAAHHIRSDRATTTTTTTCRVAATH
jgi:hypothetical protein